MKTYTLHIDSGHEWLEVPYADFARVGLSKDQVSGYSYARVTEDYVPTLYLEGDCHMPLFLNAMEAKGITFKIVEKYHALDAPVWGYGRVA